jgi:hypothetical protein
MSPKDLDGKMFKQIPSRPRGSEPEPEPEPEPGPGRPLSLSF